MKSSFSKTVLCFSLIGSYASAVPSKTAPGKTDQAEKLAKKPTIANNWGFTPVRDSSEEAARAKTVAKNEATPKTVKPAKTLSSGFKGFTPVRDELTAESGVTTKKENQSESKTETRVRRK